MRVVILGAGYASLSFLKNVASGFFDKAEVTLINANPYHYTTILLHEVVSGVKEKSVLFDLKEILPPKVTFIQDTVTQIEHGNVVCQKGTYEYDMLIVGLGFQSDTFGVEGIKEYAYTIVNFESALKLKERVFGQLQRYKVSNDENDLKFVVCGGGFTGIELIASLNHTLREAAKHEGIDPALISITCVEANPKILPMLPQNLIGLGTNYLQEAGVKLATGCKILRCLEDGVVMQKGDDIEEKIHAHTVIWTAGVKGNAVIENSPFFTSNRSKVEVDGFLQPIGQENQAYMKNIYVIGDCAALKDPISQRFYPPTAQIANKQGLYLANALMARIEQREFSEQFSYQPEGTICSLGEEYALAMMGEKKFLGKEELAGKLAIWLKRIVEMTWRRKLNGLKGIFNGK